MYERSPFVVRRVLAGVLIGCCVLALAAFAVVRHRVADYHHREDAVVAAYRMAYTACSVQQGPYAACGTKVRRLCLADRFWDGSTPFALGLGGNLGSDRSSRCTFPGG